MQDENEVPDDETINQMIARTENEFEIFNVRPLFDFLFNQSNTKCASI